MAHNPADFKPSQPSTTNPRPEERKAPEQPDDFTSTMNPNLMSFSPPLFPPGFINPAFQNNMYQNYQQPYMPMPYEYQQQPYRGTNHYEKKSYGGHRKPYNSSYGSTTQVLYAKKPKPPLKADGLDVAEDFAKLNFNDVKSDPDGNVMDKVNKLDKALFFVIKSYSEEDIYKAVKHNVWCSTKHGNVKLHNAFVTANNEYPIFLLFSVNSSGHFVGIAQMKSPVDFNKNFPTWNQSEKWKGLFQISWIYMKDVPNRELRHLPNELNEGKPVPNSRDCQEVPFEVGVQVLAIFEKYKHQTSILDDFDFYEMQATQNAKAK